MEGHYSEVELKRGSKQAVQNPRGRLRYFHFPTLVTKLTFKSFLYSINVPHTIKIVVMEPKGWIKVLNPHFDINLTLNYFVGFEILHHSSSLWLIANF